MDFLTYKVEYIKYINFGDSERNMSRMNTRQLHFCYYMSSFEVLIF